MGVGKGPLTCSCHCRRTYWRARRRLAPPHVTSTAFPSALSLLLRPANGLTLLGSSLDSKKGMLGSRSLRHSLRLVMGSRGRAPKDRIALMATRRSL